MISDTILHYSEVEELGHYMMLGEYEKAEANNVSALQAASKQSEL